jgi:CubicO group peptidase (beta-lactamase class C family)
MTRFIRTSGDVSSKANGLDDADRRQFLGYTRAGMLATALSGNGGSGNPYGKTIAWGQSLLQNAIADNSQNVASISVALLKGDRIVWHQAFGNASDGMLATVQTRYNIASVSKIIAALAALILQEQGGIDLDKLFVQYLPFFTMLSPAFTQITIRQLLSYSAGLLGSNYHNLNTLGASIPGYAQDTMQALANQHLKYLPGQTANYGNDGITLIEPLIETVTGISYSAFVQEYILTPLNMTNSGYLTSVPSSGSFALPYENGQWYAQEIPNGYAAGGLSTTPADMMNLAQVLLGNGVFQGRYIVSAEAIAQMGMNLTTQLPLDPATINAFGLGWDHVRYAGLAFAGNATWLKGGQSPSFRSLFMVLPEVQMALMLTGSTGYAHFELGSAIVKRALQEDGSIVNVSPPTVSASIPQAAPAPDVTASGGVYGSHDAPLQVIVTQGSLQINQWTGFDGGGNSRWQPRNDGATQYVYCSDGWWWSYGNTACSYRFVVAPGADANGNVSDNRYLIERKSGDYWLNGVAIGQQLTQRPALDAAWRARMHTQWVPNNEASDSPLMVRSGGTGLTCRVASLLELPGYVLFGAEDFGYQLLVPSAHDRATPSIMIPGEHGDDLYEIVFDTTVNNVETMIVGGLQYRIDKP